MLVNITAVTRNAISVAKFWASSVYQYSVRTIRRSLLDDYITRKFQTTTPSLSVIVTYVTTKHNPYKYVIKINKTSIVSTKTFATI